MGHVHVSAGQHRLAHRVPRRCHGARHPLAQRHVHTRQQVVQMDRRTSSTRSKHIFIAQKKKNLFF